jgi:hypothetical protein
MIAVLEGGTRSLLPSTTGAPGSRCTEVVGTDPLARSFKSRLTTNELLSPYRQ